MKTYIHQLWENKKSIRIGLYFLIGSLLCFLFLNLLFPLQTDIEYSKIVYDRKGKVLSAYLTSDDKWRMKTELGEITPALQKAIIHKEDKYFYYHPGINPLAIIRAMFNNILHRKRTSGASTITMQVARLLQPKKRTYLNKLVEIFRSLQLEWTFSKKEILQLYLNLAPYGGNIEGVKSASVLFFDKLPDHLSIAELTTLSLIPNRPTTLALGKNNLKTKVVRDKWLKRFEREGVFSKENIADALKEPLKAERRNAPAHAPHFSYRAKTENQQANIKTTIDFNIQKSCEKITYNYVQRIYQQQIRNAAAIVINNKTQEVLAYVGSADFYNNEDGGQVDGIKAIRSPGSTLKPLVYGLAFDKGLITPKLKISDVPVNYSGYAPINYDSKYNGMVSMEYALEHSLNVPAVKVLHLLGKDIFLEKLEQAQFKQIAKAKKVLGLSVVLGGCGVSLEQLAGLYSSFANKGRFIPVKMYRHDETLKNTSNKHQQQSDSLYNEILSKGAAYIVTEMLSKLTRPDLPAAYENSKNLPKIAWKTGTSFGRKDAWSIGYNANYTIGVWVGNFSGQGVPELTGSTIATPLLFEIFNSIDYAPDSDWFIEPKSLDYRWVCSETGLPAQDFCEAQVMDYYYPAITFNNRCEHLKEVWLSADERYAYCRTCCPANGFKKKMFHNYLPEIIAHLEKENIHYEKLPPHNPDCERIFNDFSLKIISPVDGLEYLIDPNDNTELMLSCSGSNDVDTVYWYLNDVFYQSAGITESIFFTPKTGNNKITCVDDKGRKKDVWVKVKML